MTPTIRPIRADDRPGWNRLWTAYLGFYDTTVAAQVYDAQFARLTGDDPTTFRGLLATLDDRPVGLAHYLFHPHGWRLEPVCYLQDLYTDAAVRGAGVGRTLIQAVYEAADARGAPHFYWITDGGNTVARRFYDRIGRATDFMQNVRA